MGRGSTPRRAGRRPCQVAEGHKGRRGKGGAVVSLEQGGVWGTLAPPGNLFCLPYGDSGCPDVPRFRKSMKILHKVLGKNPSRPGAQARDGRRGLREAQDDLQP